MDYFISGPLLVRAREIEDELKKGVRKPFDEVIKMNIGDAQAMGQIPITFIRQIYAIVSYPTLLESSDFPEDVKSRAKEILEGCSGKSVGAYSASAGIEMIRKHAANYVEGRDGYPCDWKNVYLTNGASHGIRSVLRLFVDFESNKKPGALYPIPQYPIYPVTLEDMNIQKVGYYLNEKKNWNLDIAYLEKLYEKSKADCVPKALVVINPGNPTGQVLSKENIKEIIKFAHEKQLFLLADEVYQDNIYPDDMKFHSFKKVLFEMGLPYSKMPMASFMSCSKGYMGECGLRGGYVEVINLAKDMEAKLSRCLSSTLCPSVMGQISVYCITNPPKIGESSYELFMKEKMDALKNLKIKAKFVSDGFNSLEGFSCNEVQGSMYAFPRVHLPRKAIEIAKSCGLPPDEFYTFKLLERTGICVLPGVAFGQEEGTYHFRSTILPNLEILKKMMKLLSEFNKEFYEEYK